MTTRDDVKSLNAEYAQAYATGDVERMASLHTEDAWLLFYDTPVLQGRAEVAELFRKEFEEGLEPITFESLEIMEAGDLVVDIGLYTTPKVRAKYVVVFKRQPDGTLKIAVDADVP